MFIRRHLEKNKETLVKKDLLLDSINKGEKWNTYPSYFAFSTLFHDPDSTFSIVREKGDSPEEYQEIKRFARLKGKGYVELAVLHDTEDNKITRAILIKEISKKDLISIANLHSQDAVIMKRKKRIFLEKRRDQGPPDNYEEYLLSIIGDGASIGSLLSPLFDNAIMILEREPISIWHEWFISVKNDGDDTYLWKNSLNI
jgi:hypothetical protein